MGMFWEIGMWRKSRPIRRSIKVRLPEKDVTLWELDDADVGVIETKPMGGILSFHVENRPYGVVKGNVKRLATRLRKKEDSNGLH